MSRFGPHNGSTCGGGFGFGGGGFGGGFSQQPDTHGQCCTHWMILAKLLDNTTVLFRLPVNIPMRRVMQRMNEAAAEVFGSLNHELKNRRISPNGLHTVLFNSESGGSVVIDSAEVMEEIIFLLSHRMQHQQDIVCGAGGPRCNRCHQFELPISIVDIGEKAESPKKIEKAVETSQMKEENMDDVLIPLVSLAVDSLTPEINSRKPSAPVDPKSSELLATLNSQRKYGRIALCDLCDRALTSREGVYRCMVCSDYDLCMKCAQFGTHSEHALLWIQDPEHTLVPFGRPIPMPYQRGQPQTHHFESGMEKQQQQQNADGNKTESATEHQQRIEKVRSGIDYLSTLGKRITDGFALMGIDATTEVVLDGPATKSNRKHRDSFGKRMKKENKERESLGRKGLNVSAKRTSVSSDADLVNTSNNESQGNNATEQHEQVPVIPQNPIRQAFAPLIEAHIRQHEQVLQQQKQQQQETMANSINVEPKTLQQQMMEQLLNTQALIRQQLADQTDVLRAAVNTSNNSLSSSSTTSVSHPQTVPDKSIKTDAEEEKLEVTQESEQDPLISLVSSEHHESDSDGGEWTEVSSASLREISREMSPVDNFSPLLQQEEPHWSPIGEQKSDNRPTAEQEAKSNGTSSQTSPDHSISSTTGTLYPSLPKPDTHNMNVPAATAVPTSTPLNPVSDAPLTNTQPAAQANQPTQSIHSQQNHIDVGGLVNSVIQALHPAAPQQETLNQLLQMGYDRRMARRAVSRHGADLEACIDYMNDIVE